MIWLIDTIVPAALLSGAAAVCLLGLPEAPPRLRLAIALVGLAAWIVPWPLVRIPLDVPGLDILRISSGSAALDAARSDFAALGAAASIGNGGLGLTLVALLVGPGLIGCLHDFRTLRALTRRWRTTSSPGERLRRLLPPELRDVRAEIRIVHGTRVAAATGWLLPTVWVGDEFENRDDLELALIHECWHVRRRDPLMIAAIALIKRLYWWNPLTAWLARRAVLEVESACDRRSAAAFGRDRYVRRLASLMLDETPTRAPPLMAGAHRGNLDIERLKRLMGNTRLERRDCALIAALALTAAGAVAAQRLTPPAERPAWSRVSIPDTPAGDALEALLGAFNAGDSEFIDAYLGAYMPQQVSWELYDWNGGAELLDIVESGRLNIGYVVRDAAGFTQRLGRLEVADSEPTFVTHSVLRDLPGAAFN